MSRLRITTTPLVCMLVFGPAAAMPVVLGVMTGFIPIPQALRCTTETVRQLPNLSGFDFKIAYSDCALIGSALTINVFVSKAGGNEREHLFEYDPIHDRPDEDLPSISVSDQGRISISVPQIAAIYVQEHSWKGTPIDYEFERVVDRGPEHTRPSSQPSN